MYCHFALKRNVALTQFQSESLLIHLFGESRSHDAMNLHRSTNYFVTFLWIYHL